MQGTAHHYWQGGESGRKRCTQRSGRLLRRCEVGIDAFPQFQAGSLEPYVRVFFSLTTSTQTIP